MSCSEFFDAEDLGEKDADENQAEDLEAEIRTRGSDSSSEAGSLSSGEGSISSESDLGADYNQTNSLSEIEGRRFFINTPILCALLNINILIYFGL